MEVRLLAGKLYRGTTDGTMYVSSPVPLPLRARQFA